MKFAIIVPDRNDRPELTAFAFKQLSRMSASPEKVYHINYTPVGEGFDLIDRVFLGCVKAKNDGIDWVFIFENDDYYPFNYFDRFLPYMEKYDFIGQDFTTYYNLQNLTYRTFDHPHRSSLFTTAFRISALNNFEWPDNSKPFLDIELWKYARFKRRKFIETGAMGMKHGLGLCGGKGHQFNMPGKDNDLVYLRQHTDEIGFQFYRTMSEKLRAKV